jgi:hypothetical protein
MFSFVFDLLLKTLVFLCPNLLCITTEYLYYVSICFVSLLLLCPNLFCIKKSIVMFSLPCVPICFVSLLLLCTNLLCNKCFLILCIYFLNGFFNR